MRKNEPFAYSIGIQELESDKIHTVQIGIEDASTIGDAVDAAFEKIVPRHDSKTVHARDVQKLRELFDLMREKLMVASDGAGILGELRGRIDESCMEKHPALKAVSK